jgi:hypothetical protein
MENTRVDTNIRGWVVEKKGFTGSIPVGKLVDLAGLAEVKLVLPRML